LEQIQKRYADPKLKAVLKNIKTNYEKVPKIERKVWASVVSSDFTRNELQTEFDFEVSKRQFSKSRKLDKEDPNKIGRKPIEEQIKENIKKFSYDNTREAANRTVQERDGKEKRIIPVRYTPCCIRCLFYDFKNNFQNTKISESCFRSYLPKEIKSVGKKRTDLCTYCEKKKTLSRSLQVSKFIIN
jgi:hypothetical protein